MVCPFLFGIRRFDRCARSFLDGLLFGHSARSGFSCRLPTLTLSSAGMKAFFLSSQTWTGHLQGFRFFAALAITFFWISRDSSNEYDCRTHATTQGGFQFPVYLSRVPP